MNRSKTIQRLLVPALAALVALLLASTASADYEQVPEHFGSGEGKRMLEGEVLAMAVNASGAGGVVPGTFYAVTSGLGAARRAVLRFSPGEEGKEPEFQEAWGWAIANDAEEFQRCGPALTTEPAQHTFDACSASPSNEFGGEGIGHFETLSGLAIDQQNGYVYVRNQNTGPRKNNLIEVFTATGTPVGEGFGDVANEASIPPESISESPGKLHRGDLSNSSLAVDATGTVYVGDRDYFQVEGQPQYRVMSFKPAGGSDFTHYAYTGQASDLLFKGNEVPDKIAIAGNRLVGARGEQIHTYALQSGIASPICSLPVSGRLAAMAANPLTGEVFYFNETKKSVFRLSACNEATGKFTQLQQLKPAPTTEIVQALAVDPSNSWSALRPAGTLYVPSELETAGGKEFVGDIFASAPILAPLVKAESVAHTGTTATVLQALIDPRGFNTSYSFQYLPASTYAAQLAAAKGEGKSGAEAEAAAFAGALSAPMAPGQLEAGAVRKAAVSIGGLAPDTAYSFRVLASSECNGAGEPLCETDGQAASFATYPAALPGLPDGRAYELVSPAQKNGGEVFPADPGISSCTLTCKPPGTALSQVDPMQSAPNGDAVAYMGYAFNPTEGAAVFNSYVSRRTADGWQTTAETPFRQYAKSQGTFAYSRDLAQGTVDEAHISLQATSDPSALTPLVPPPSHRSVGDLHVVYSGYSVDFSSQFFSANDAFPLKPGTAFAPEPPDPGNTGTDLYEWRGGQLSLVNVLPDGTIAEGAGFVAVGSADAHPVSADGSRVFWHVGATVYVREGQQTREITHSGDFVLASEDGGGILLSDGCLYSLATESCTDLTEGGGGFQGVVGAVGNLSRIYFVDTAKLPTSGENEREEEAVAGKPNLYLHEAGTAARFIATLNASNPTGEASPDGRYLAFASTRNLTGYTNVGPCETITNKNNEFEVVPAPCMEVYLYDSTTARLSCPSCNPTGEAPLGKSNLREINGAKPFFPQPRYLTDAGRLFFDSPDPLSPRDTNGKVEDVYEYEPKDVGGCEREAGCVSLVSPGSGSVDSNFLAMDEGGANVFFTTRERLVPQDTDELIDLYDAREGGGFPAETETQRAECQGESCQPVATAPNDATPASSSFHGAGNVKEATKPKKKHKHKKKKHKKKHGRTANPDRGGAK
jgi:hypothetical protein